MRCLSSVGTRLTRSQGQDARGVELTLSNACRFPGSQPVSFDLQSLQLLEQEE